MENKVVLDDEQLEKTSGGWFPTQSEVNACNAVMEKYQWKQVTLYNNYVSMHALPCIGCGYYRNYDTDFVD